MTKKWIVPALLSAAAIVALVVFTGVWTIRSEPVTIAAGDVTLAGTLAMPRWQSGPFPAAVIVHGSGRVGRDELRGWVRRLVPLGLAVLVYDKRGVGGSGGEYRSAVVGDSPRMIAQLADDAAAAFEALQRHDVVDPRRVGFVGGSQAGWVMPLAAARCGEAAFVVSVSGPAVTYGQEIHYSRLTGDDPGPWSGLSDEEIRARMASFAGPHGYDPLPVLESLEVPQLWILGGRDRSVPTELSVRNLEALRAGGRSAIEIRLFREGDHALRHVDTGARLDYWADVRDWLEQQGVIGTRAGDRSGRD